MEMGDDPRAAFDGEAMRSLLQRLEPDIVDLSEQARRLASEDWTPLATKHRALGLEWPLPAAVVKARREQDVLELLQWSTSTGIPVHVSGGRSSVVGALGADAAPYVVLDMTAMDAILDVNDVDATVLVEPGVLGGDLLRKLAAKGLELVHQPQSLHLSTVGGWVSTRAAGVFSSAYGSIEELITSLRVVLPSGEVLDMDMSPRRSVGPDLRHLFIGAEGTLGVVTRIGLSLRPPVSRRLRGYALPGLASALEVARSLAQSSVMPSLVRVYDAVETRRYLDAALGECLIILGWDYPPGIADAAEADAESTVEGLRGRACGEGPARAWFDHRQEVDWLPTASARPGGFIETIEVATSWSSALEAHAILVDVVRGYLPEVEAHFSHVYPSGTCMYIIMRGDFADDRAAYDVYLRVWEALTESALRLGLGISHHHGIGRIRVPWIERERAGDIVLLRAIKHMLDPRGLLNPGVLFPEMRAPNVAGHHDPYRPFFTGVEE